MQFAARDVEPVDGHLDDSPSGLPESNKKLDVEGKPLLAQTAADRLVAAAPYELESALRIVDRYPCNDRNKRRENSPAKMPQPGAADRPTQDLATGCKQGVGHIVFAEHRKNAKDLVWRDRTIRVHEPQPFRFVIQIPALVD